MRQLHDCICYIAQLYWWELTVKLFHIFLKQAGALCQWSQRTSEPPGRRIWTISARGCRGHPPPTPETDSLALKAEIERRLKNESDVAFTLNLMRLTALAGDSLILTLEGGETLSPAPLSAEKLKI